MATTNEITSNIQIPTNLMGPIPGHRRRFTIEQKKHILKMASKPGSSYSATGRQHGLSASLLFRWRKALEEAQAKAMEAHREAIAQHAAGHDMSDVSETTEIAAPVTEDAKDARIRELERMLGRVTFELELARERQTERRVKTHEA